MTDFKDPLITNIGMYASSPVMTSVNMGQLGEKLRQARISAIASLSQALYKNVNCSGNATSIPSLSPTRIPTGQLELNIVEARNLTITDADKSDTYCIVHYEGNMTSTLDPADEDILPRITWAPQANVDSGAFKAFEVMMRASSPKWMHPVKFNVNSGNQKISLFVYDRGDKLPNGEHRFLGMSSIVPHLIHQKTVELVFPLVGHRPHDDQEVTGDVRLQVTYSNTRKLYPKPEHFRMVRLINQGSIAKVYEVVKRDSGRTFAIKVLPKHRLVSESLVGTVFHERNVLVQSLASCPFIADLKYSFQTTRHLFLVTDYFAGGELFDFFEHERCLNETWCQFIAAEIVCALDHIHSRNMVYCNLKLENILLDAHGHLALTHFGLCQQLETDQDDAIYGVSNNVTQEYMAPEMVLQRPYGKLVDWWSLGILMFELLTGSPPFHSVNEVELIRQIMYGPIKFPAGGCISKEAKDFVYQLLHRHPAKRLGYRSGASQVKAHPFFDTVNWDMVYKKQMQCPFRLEIQNQLQEKAADSIRIIPATTNTATAMKTKTIKPQVIPALDQTIFNGFSFAGEDGSIKKGLHILGVDPDDEDPEVDVWFRK